MSVLQPGDERWHYSDGSHRWACRDPAGDQQNWTEQVRAHVEQHGAGRDTPSGLVTPPRRGHERATPRASK